MKKLFVLVSCFAVLLVLSNVSFAQEEVAVEVAPCTCGAAALSDALPFAYPYYPAPRGGLGDRLAALKGKCPLAQKNPAFPPVPPQAMSSPMPPQAFAGYPVGAPDMRPLAARRAARLAQQLQPYPPYQFPVAGTPQGVPFAPPAFVPGQPPVPMIPATQMGDANKVLQRAGGSPVVNFMSIVRAPQQYPPYGGYYYPNYGYPLPEDAQ